MTDIKANQVKELRVKTGMTRKVFADAFGIPLGTLRNWEQGVRTPPEYVVEMLTQFVDGVWKFNYRETNSKTAKVNDLIVKADGLCIVFEELLSKNNNPLENKMFQKQVFDFLYQCRFLYEYVMDSQCDKQGSLSNVISKYTDSESFEIYVNAVKVVKIVFQNNNNLDITKEFNL